MGALSRANPGDIIRSYGLTYSWSSLGFESPLTQEEQDAWLLEAMLAIADGHPDLTRKQREEVRFNACEMYLGLRTVGKVYRNLT